MKNPMNKLVKECHNIMVLGLKEGKASVLPSWFYLSGAGSPG